MGNSIYADETPYIADGPTRPAAIDPATTTGAIGALSQLIGKSAPVPAPAPADPAPAPAPRRGGLSPAAMQDLEDNLGARVRSPEQMQAAAEARKGGLAALKEANNMQPNTNSFLENAFNGMDFTSKPWDSGYAFRGGVRSAMDIEQAKQAAARANAIANAQAQMKFDSGEESIAVKEEQTALNNASKIASAQTRSGQSRNNGLLNTPAGVVNTNFIDENGAPKLVMPSDEVTKLMGPALARAAQAAKGLVFNNPEEQTTWIQDRAKQEVMMIAAMRSGGQNPTGNKTLISPAGPAAVSSTAPGDFAETGSTPNLGKVPPALQQQRDLNAIEIAKADVVNAVTPADKLQAQQTLDRMLARSAAGQSVLTGPDSGPNPGAGPGTIKPTFKTDSPLTPDAIMNAAARYNIDGTLPALGMGTQATVARTLILNKAADLHAASGNTAEAARVTQLANRANATALGQLQKQHTMVSAFERTANFNADVALELSGKVDRTGMPIVNAWIQAGQKAGTDNPELRDFHVATETFLNEYAKIMSGSMGNTPVSDSMRAEAKSMLSTANTPNEYKAIILRMKGEMSNRMKGFDEEKAALRGSMLSQPPAKADAPAADKPASKKLTYDPATRTFH